MISILYKEAWKRFSTFELNSAFSVPILAKQVDRGLLFRPTRVNTLTQYRILGNYGFLVVDYTQKEYAEETRKALQNPDSFDRQKMLVDQIKIINSLENYTWQNFTQISGKKDVLLHNQLASPLLLTVPFTNSDLRKAFYREYEDESDQTISDILTYVLNMEYTHNYVTKPKKGLPKSLKQHLFVASRLIIERRSEFLDMIGVLHSSFRNSPYMRMPQVGVSINLELSFVRPNLNYEIVSSKKKKSVGEVMAKFGRKLAKYLLSDSTKEMLAKRPSQIIAISDLPVEWLDIDGIPLGFTHDVCRMPETPYSGLLQRYVVSRLSHYVIPNDILQHTLVVYGCRDKSFKPYQDECDDLSHELGFVTCECLTKEDFFKALDENKPQLLIIDAHGGINSHSRYGYLMMVNEEVTADDIRSHQMMIPLVFLSVCNTEPLYENYNSVPNAFLGNCSLSVTSSYLPLNVTEASLIYLRLLKQLNEVATKKIHANWLEFVSYILRSSYIQSFYKNKMLRGKESNESLDNNFELTLMEMKSMIFQERRKIYKNLQKGILLNGDRVAHPNIIPHYLMYSTLGRADLIRFKSFFDENIQSNQKFGSYDMTSQIN